MTRLRWLGFGAAACVAAGLFCVPLAGAAVASPQGATARAPAHDVSAQNRRARRAPTRIEVRPLRRAPERLYPDSYRECVPVMVERWIPQWGGRVIHASQSCWWTR